LSFPIINEPFMRRSCFAALMALALWQGQGCKKSSTNGAPVTPFVHDTSYMRTAVGTPVGSPVTQTIDASGGTISSPDGVLQLTIPAGALSAPTLIGIQPVTNEVPVGLYNGYSLTPNGQQFQKPVTLQFHYKDADLDSVDPAGLGVAYQSGDSTWEAFTDVAVDTIGKTVTVQTPHFTIFDLLPDLRLYPEHTIIGIGKTLHLDEQLHYDADPNSRIPSFVRYTSAWYNLFDAAAKPTTIWAVNNITGGNKTIGTITTGVENSAVYTAPATVPSPSTVYATVTKLFGHSKVILRSKIRIVDGNAWHVYCQYFAPGIDESGTYYNWSDAGSFDVVVSKGIGSVVNISNRNATITLDHNSSTCTTTLVNPAVGPINIDYTTDGGFVSYTSGMITILFDLGGGTNNYIQDATWKTQCPGGQPTQMGGGLGPPWPSSLQFPALDQMQTIVNGQYSITVTQIQ
jgi:hypothetical protein